MSALLRKYPLWFCFHKWISPVSYLKPQIHNLIEKNIQLRSLLDTIVESNPQLAVLVQFIKEYHNTDGELLHLEFIKLIIVWQGKIRQKYYQEENLLIFAEMSNILADSESFNPYLYKRTNYNNYLCIYHLLCFYPILPDFHWIPPDLVDVLAKINGTTENKKIVLDAVIKWVETNNPI